MTWLPLALGVPMVAALLSDTLRRSVRRARFVRRWSPGIARAMDGERAS